LGELYTNVETYKIAIEAYEKRSHGLFLFLGIVVPKEEDSTIERLTMALY